LRKKYRNITIDNDNTWSWGVIRNRWGQSTIKIWKDKNLKYEKTYTSDPEWVNPPTGMPKVTPGLIYRFIKIYLKPIEDAKS
jgi:hypothetical protein